MDKEALKKAIELYVFDFGYVPLDIRIRLNHELIEIHFSIFKKKNITLMDCSRVTLAVREFLLNYLGSDNFSLDVSSPGAERILKEPLEYSLFEGKKARLIFADGSEKKVILKDFRFLDNMIVFIDVLRLEEHNVPLSEVIKCQLILE